MNDSPLLSVAVLKDEIAAYQKEIDSKKEAKLNQKSKKLLNKWMELINAEYIREALIEAGLINASEITLLEVKDPYQDGRIDYKHLYYDIIEPHSQSLENHIKQFIDAESTRVFATIEDNTVRIYLHWRSTSLYCPTVCYTKPSSVCCTICIFITVSFIALVTILDNR